MFVANGRGQLLFNIFADVIVTVAMLDIGEAVFDRGLHRAVAVGDHHLCVLVEVDAEAAQGLENPDEVIRGLMRDHRKSQGNSLPIEKKKG